MKAERRVLKDHKQVGKKLIPPFLDAFQNFNEVPHVKLVVPELIWLAALNDVLGAHEGARLCLEVARPAALCDPQAILATCTSYSKLTAENWSSIVSAIAELDRNRISLALSPLSRLYPDFPLKPLVSESDLNKADDEADILWMMGLLPNLFDKTSIAAVGMMANATYIAFITDKLKAAHDTSLADFPEVEKYPETEKSQRVAAAIRCFANSLVGGLGEEAPRDWPRYFWNRGLELSGCFLEGEE